MMLHCKNCKKKFYLNNEDEELEGKLVECKFCNEKWLYESKSKYLENRLAELNQDLNNTDSKINLRKKDFQEKINRLEIQLKDKIIELDKQKLLKDQVTTFENRLKETEKLNNEELELHKKAGNIKKQIRITTEDISSSNKDIEEKTNYLETKINSYNNAEQEENEQSTPPKPQIVDNEVVDININDKFKKSKENKKRIFFSPNFLK